MGNPGGPFGGPYAGQGNQGLGNAGLGPQLQNKGPMANNLAQFNVEKKNQPMQGMAAMVGYQDTHCQYFPPPSPLPFLFYLLHFLFPFLFCLLVSSASSSFSLALYFPGFPAVTNRCGRSLCWTRRGRPRDGA